MFKTINFVYIPFFSEKMSKISYSYFALRQLSDGFTPMFSGGHGVFAPHCKPYPGHKAFQKSKKKPAKSELLPKQSSEKSLPEKKRSFYGDFLTKPKQETEVSKNPLPVGEGKEFSIDISTRYSKSETEGYVSFKPEPQDKHDYDSYEPNRSIKKTKLPKYKWEPKIDPQSYAKERESDYLSISSKSERIFDNKYISTPKVNSPYQCQNIGKSNDLYLDKFTNVTAPIGHKYVKGGITTTGYKSTKNSSNKTMEPIIDPKTIIMNKVIY